MRRRTTKPKPFWNKAKRRWVARITLDGKRRERVFRSRAEAADQLNEWWQVRQAGGTLDGQTLRVFADHWVAVRVLSPGTRERYTRWLAHMGGCADIPVPLLRRKHIVAMLQDVPRIATRNSLQSLVQTILADAVERELLPTNPVVGIRKARHTKRAVEIFTPDEVAAIQDAAEGHRYQAAFELALEVGLRPGELWGLRWSDLDGDDLRVARTVRVVGGQLQVSETPKTRAGIRTIPLSARIRGHLHTRQQAALREGRAGKQCPMFPGQRGGVTWPSNARRLFKLLLAEAGVANRHLYTCRHTAASVMLNGGVPLPIVSAILGHNSGEVTLRVYSHLIGTETDRVRDFWNQQTREGELERVSSRG